MATTRIIPLHTGKGRTVGKAISDIIDYAAMHDANQRCNSPNLMRSKKA